MTLRSMRRLYATLIVSVFVFSLAMLANVQPALPPKQPVARRCAAPSKIHREPSSVMPRQHHSTSEPKTSAKQNRARTVLTPSLLSRPVPTPESGSAGFQDS